MSAWFTYRSPYDALLGKHVRRLPDDSVLAWFQRNWNCAGKSEDEDEQHARAGDWLRDELETDPYGLSSIFTRAARDKIPAPTTEEELFGLLREHLYVEGDKDEQLLCRPGCIQVYTDDDNLDVAYYFCDDKYLSEYGTQAAFLLHEHWRLPTLSSPDGFVPKVPPRRLRKGGRGEGGTWLVTTSCCGKCELAELHKTPPAFLPGVRMPELPDFLRGHKAAVDWPAEFVLLRIQMPEPGEVSNDDLWDALDRIVWFPGRWVLEGLEEVQQLERAEARRLLSDNRLQMVHEKGRPNGNLCRIQTSAHLAQLCWLVAHAPQWSWGRNVYHQWYLFDDCWASANPDLAHGLLRFATRWDVLTPE